jgi:outer membrane immunogenic protein
MRNSKLIFSATVAISAIVGIGAVSAADLAARPYTKAPAPVLSPVYNWSGFYIGLNGGGGSAHTCWDILNNASGAPVIPSQSEGCHNATGGTVGGQVGYRWQATNWVFGLEAQGNWANFKGSNVNISPAANGGVPNVFNDLTKVDAFGLFTGQVGYAFNNVLVYAKGGAAVVSDKYSNTLTANGAALLGPGFFADQTFATGSETRWGGTAGGGVEFGFAPHWSVALEYDHLFMGRKTVTNTLVPPFGVGLSGIHSISQDIDIGTVRVNYTFGGPVVAKY